MANVEATIVVQFGEGVDTEALAILELDEVRNVIIDSEGKSQIITQFAPGYSPHFLFHYDASLEIEKISYSAGDVVKTTSNSVSRERTQQLQFIKETLLSDEAYQTLTYVPNSIVSQEWFTDPNAVNVGQDWLVQAERRHVHITDDKVRIMNLTYNVLFEQYRLDPPAMSLGEGDTFPILVVFYMRNRP